VYGSSGWQHPYTAKRSLICSTSRFTTSTIPRQWKEAKIQPLPKLPAPKKHADYRPITPYHTNYVQTDGAKRGPHIPLSDVSRPTDQSGILRSIICFPPQWLHINCHHLPTSQSHRYQPAAIQSFCRRHMTGLIQGVRHHPTLHAVVQVG